MTSRLAGSSKKRRFVFAKHELAANGNRSHSIVASSRLQEAAMSGAWVKCSNGRTTVAAMRPSLRQHIPAQVLHDLAVGSAAAPRRLRMIRIAGAVIDGTLDFESDELVAPVFLYNCVLEEANFEQARAPGVFIRRSQVRLLQATQLVADNLYLDGTVCTAGLTLNNARIDGVLNLEGSRLVGADAGLALRGHNLDVGRDVCARALRTEGAIDLTGAHVGGCIDLSDAHLRAAQGTALDASSLLVEHDARCCGDFVAEGEVRLVGAVVKGQLDLRGAEIVGTTVRALSADLLRVDRDMRCDKMEPGTRALRVKGPLRLPGAHVAGRLDLSGVEVTNPESPKGLFAEGVDVGEDLRACSIKVEGRSSFAGARIGDKLNVCGANFTEHLDLEHARATKLMDIETSWPLHMSLNDFEYHAFPEVERTDSVKPRLAWIGRNTGGYAPGVYNHLASVYRSAGETDAARRVLMAKQRAKAAERRQGRGRLFRMGLTVTDRLLEWTIGYGYRPFWIIWWLVGLLVVASAVFAGLHDGRQLTPKPGLEGLPFSAPVYSLDLLLPVASLGQRGNYVASGAALWLSTTFMLTGWILGLTLVAGLSGLFKKD